MSSYKRETKHPVTGKWEIADCLDDYFGQHRYGVKFGEGDVYEADKYEWETRNNYPTTNEQSLREIGNEPEEIRAEFKKKYYITDDEDGRFRGIAEYSDGVHIIDFWLSHLTADRQKLVEEVLEIVGNPSGRFHIQFEGIDDDEERKKRIKYNNEISYYINQERQRIRQALSALITPQQ